MGQRRYTNLIECGRSADAISYLARDVDLGRDVELVAHHAPDNAPERPAPPHEARVFGMLEHPAIPTVLETGRLEDGSPFYTKLLARGRTLASIIAATPNRRARLAYVPNLATVAKALAHAHERSVYHGHVTAENILIGPRGETFVTDWADAVCPPLHDQSAGDAREDDFARRDVRALATVLRGLIGGSISTIGAAVVDSKSDAYLMDIVDRAFDADGPDAIRGADKLAAALDEWRNSLHGSRRPMRRMRGPSKRRKRTLVLAAIGTLMLTAGVGVILAVRDSPNAPPAIAALAGADRGIARNLRSRSPQGERLERAEYASLVNDADRQMATHLFDAARRALESAPADLRHWEWAYLTRRACLYRASTPSGGPALNSIDISPDGRVLATACANGSIRLWNADTLVSTTELNQHEGPAHVVAFNRDGTRLVSASADETAVIWNTSNGRVLAEFTEHRSSILAASFDPTGNRVATGAVDGTARLWDAETSKQLDVFEAHHSAVSALAFDSAGRTLAYGTSSGAIFLRVLGDAQGPRPAYTIDGGVRDLAWSPDGTLLAASTQSGTIRVFDIESGTPLEYVARHEWAVWDVAFDPTGALLASAGGDSAIKLWRVADGVELARLEGHGGEANSLVFSPDGATLYSAGDDGRVLRWHVADWLGVDASEPQPGDPLIWTILPEIPGRPSSVALSAEGHMAAIGTREGKIGVYNAVDTAPVTEFDAHERAVTALAFDARRSRIASGGEDHFVYVWNAATGDRLAAFEGHDGAPSALAFSPDGRYLASAGHDAQGFVWNIETGKRLNVLRGHSARMLSVTFSPTNGAVATGSNDKEAWLWILDQPEPVTMIAHHALGIDALEFTPGGRFLLSGGRDHKIVIDDLLDPEFHRVLTGHWAHVTDLCVSPDGARLFSAGLDGAIVVWDMASARQLLTLRKPGARFAQIAFNPGDSSLVAAEDNGTITQWSSFHWNAEEFRGKSGQGLWDAIESAKRKQR
ncbi:MAG: WD40 repeat domain-containing serine/threonine-protein kinase [Candidatus Hydrogenedentota bacterium]